MLSHVLLVVFLSGFAGLVALAIAAAVIAAIDWQPVVEALASLAVMVVAMYWASTFLPGPVKRVGKAVGRGVAGVVKKRRQGR